MNPLYDFVGVQNSALQLPIIISDLNFPPVGAVSCIPNLISDDVLTWQKGRRVFLKEEFILVPNMLQNTSRTSTAAVLALKKAGKASYKCHCGS